MASRKATAAETKLIPGPRRLWTFQKVGLGYEARAPEISTWIRVTRIKRSGGDLHGQVRVSTEWAGVKTIDGVLHLARFNLSSSTTRTSLAKALEARTPGMDMDWLHGLEVICQGTMVAEEAGQPYEELGVKPITRTTSGYALEPVVPGNVAAMLYGPGGSGKSVIALAGAMSIQEGREIIPGLAPMTKGNVLYLDWETDAYVIHERIQAIAAGAGFTPSELTYRRCIRPLADEAEEIAAAVAERQIVYMVIDSAGMAMGTGGEYGDSNESTLRLFDAIRHIGITAQIIDHVSKQEYRNGKGKTVGLLPYGSIYKVNLSRSAWEIRNETTEDDAKARIALVHTKANDSRLHPQLNVEIEWTPGKITFGTWEHTLADFIPDALNAKARERIIAYFRSINPAHARKSAIAKALTIPESTVGNVLYRTNNGSFTKYDDGFGLSDKELEIIPFRREVRPLWPEDDDD